MKRIISLLLIVITLSSLLVGCDIGKIWNSGTTTSPTTSTTTTTLSTSLFPENPTVEHADNFTDEDIEFIMHLHGQKMGGYATETRHYFLSDIIHNAQNGTPLYLMHFENPYVICAYLKPNQAKYQKDNYGYYYFDVSKYVWYKFYEGEIVPETIDDMRLTSFAYLLFDCTIVKDIANDIEYNKQCKYYAKYYNKNSFTYTKPDMIMYFRSKNITSDDDKFIAQPNVNQTKYEVFIDENGVEYLFFEHEAYLEDGSLYYNYSKDLFYNYNSNDFYDIALPYFEILKEQTYENGTLIKYAGIRLDILLNLEINE